MPISFGAVWGFLKGVPSGVWVAIAAAALLWWIDNRAYDRGYSARTAEYEQAAREAAERAREADGFSRGVSDNTRNEVERQNDEARDRAENSDDPLADGLRSLQP